MILSVVINAPSSWRWTCEDLAILCTLYNISIVRTFYLIIIERVKVARKGDDDDEPHVPTPRRSFDLDAVHPRILTCGVIQRGTETHHPRRRHRHDEQP